MVSYIIDGGVPARGRIKASGNKNAALPCIAACLLSDEAVELHNIPDIEDVQVMLEIMRSVGTEVSRLGPGSYRLRTADILRTDIAADLSRKIRASILLAGPLLARTGQVVLPPPGGDVIGRRRLDTHFLALSELGGRIEVDGTFRITAAKLVGCELFLDEASVTATENAIMAAVLAEGRTVIENAASEPHVQDLCRLLNAMGSHITGIGSNILYIDGARKLHGAEFAIGSDYMEVGSFIGLAAATHGEVEIENAEPNRLRMMRLSFGKLGIVWEQEGGVIRVPAGQLLRVVPDLGGQIPKIDDAPWPGFPPDLMSIILTVATQVDGTVLLHEKMFESRMYFVDKLIAMGARIVLCDPHRAVVSGPSRLKGSELVSPDVRAGMAMVIAALCAEGVSTIQNVYQIERGYERLVDRMSALRIRIERRGAPEA
jgi:UDP-N-acetylglucosamine 1-carboxyvinyltransferase